MEPEKNIQNAQAAAKRPLRSKRYPKDFKLRIIKIYLEEGVHLSHLCRESGVCKESVRRWVRSYRRSEESGLDIAAQAGEAVQVFPSRFWSGSLRLFYPDSAFPAVHVTRPLQKASNLIKGKMRNYMLN